MDLRRVSQIHFYSWIWENFNIFFFLEKLYYSNGFVKWRIFSLPFPGCCCSWGAHLPWISTWCDDASSFLCFSVWKPLAVVEILLSETATCLIPAQSSHHLEQHLQSLRETLSPRHGQCSQPGGTSPGTCHPKESQGLFGVFLTHVCDRTITSVAHTLFCFQRIFFGDWILAEKTDTEPSYFKKPLASLYCQSIQWQALCVLPSCYHVQT